MVEFGFNLQPEVELNRDMLVAMEMGYLPADDVAELRVSEYVSGELKHAFDHLGRERIFAIMIDRCDPAEFDIRLKSAQYVDYPNDVLQARSRLARTLETIEPKPERSP